MSYSVTVSDGAGGSQILTLGVDPAATDGIDAALGESERPPAPPTGVFDARLIGGDVSVAGLGEGVIADYRAGTEPFSGVYVHEISYQVGSGSTVTISWDLPTWVTGTLQDLVTGSIINVVMVGSGSHQVDNPGVLSKLKLTMVYDVPLPVQLTDFRCAPIKDWSVTLEWRTLSEVNNYGFTVQRKPAEEETFADVAGGFVPGKGTTAGPNSYAFTDTTLTGSGRYHYRLKQADLDGTIHYSQAIEISFTTTGVGEAVPADFGLLQNFPNPFNPKTVVSCQSPVASRVRLMVYDLLGREVAVLLDEYKAPGTYRVEFDGANLPSGTYICRMTAGLFVESMKMLLLR
jgi:hypothetical protein